MRQFAVSGMVVCIILMLAACGKTIRDDSQIEVGSETNQESQVDHSYPGLRHGFGIGKGTAAEGWVDEAISFWEAQNISSRKKVLTWS